MSNGVFINWERIRYINSLFKHDHVYTICLRSVCAGNVGYFSLILYSAGMYRYNDIRTMVTSGMKIIRYTLFVYSEKVGMASFQHVGQDNLYNDSHYLWGVKEYHKSTNYLLDAEFVNDRSRGSKRRIKLL